MAHIFQRFMKEDLHQVTVTVAGNNKKAIKEAIEEAEKHVRSRHVYITLDATAVKPDKINLLVAYALYVYRNFTTSHMELVELQLQPEAVVTEWTEDDKNLFVKLRSRGGKFEEYMQIPDVDWKVINAIMIHEMKEKLDKLAKVMDFYRKESEKGANAKRRSLPKRKFNFHTLNTTLLSLYSRCFNEVDRILHPSMVYNVNPSFQRDLVWSTEKKQKFIESVINEIPIGTFYVNTARFYDPHMKLSEGTGGLVWDGKQRLHAVHSFFLGEYPVEVNGEMLYYYDDPVFFSHSIDDCRITVFESAFDNLREIIEAYVIINSAQVKHTDEDLRKAILYLEEQSALGNA